MILPTNLDNEKTVEEIEKEKNDRYVQAMLKRMKQDKYIWKFIKVKKFRKKFLSLLWTSSQSI